MFVHLSLHIPVYVCIYRYMCTHADREGDNKLNEEGQHMQTEPNM